MEWCNGHTDITEIMLNTDEYKLNICFYVILPLILVISNWKSFRQELHYSPNDSFRL